MKSLFVLALCLVACSSSSDPAPAGDDGGGDASFEASGPCAAAGAACGDTISTPCCSNQCAIGPLGQFTCN